MHMKPYHCHTKETNISYPKTTNDLANKIVYKLANKKIFTPFYYAEYQKPC